MVTSDVAHVPSWNVAGHKMIEQVLDAMVLKKRLMGHDVGAYAVAFQHNAMNIMDLPFSKATGNGMFQEEKNIFRTRVILYLLVNELAKDTVAEIVTVERFKFALLVHNSYAIANADLSQDTQMMQQILAAGKQALLSSVYAK